MVHGVVLCLVGFMALCVFCVVHGVVLCAMCMVLCVVLCLRHGTLCVAWYSVWLCAVALCVVRGMVLCVVRGVVRHLDQRQNPNELRLLTHTNDRV